jgi:hypothetical protein
MYKATQKETKIYRNHTSGQQATMANVVAVEADMDKNEAAIKAKKTSSY